MFKLTFTQNVQKKKHTQYWVSLYRRKDTKESETSQAFLAQAVYKQLFLSALILFFPSPDNSGEFGAADLMRLVTTNEREF